MKPLLLLSFLPVFFSGACVRFSPEQRKAYFAPIASSADIVRAATSYRVAYFRWPENETELRQAFALAGLEPSALEQVSGLTVLKKSYFSSVYTIQYAGGGRLTLELNVR